MGTFQIFITLVHSEIQWLERERKKWKEDQRTRNVKKPRHAGGWDWLGGWIQRGSPEREREKWSDVVNGRKDHLKSPFGAHKGPHFHMFPFPAPLTSGTPTCTRGDHSSYSRVCHPSWCPFGREKKWNKFTEAHDLFKTTTALISPNLFFKIRWFQLRLNI